MLSLPRHTGALGTCLLDRWMNRTGPGAGVCFPPPSGQHPSLDKAGFWDVSRIRDPAPTSRGTEALEVLSLGLQASAWNLGAFQRRWSAFRMSLWDLVCVRQTALSAQPVGS